MDVCTRVCRDALEHNQPPALPLFFRSGTIKKFTRMYNSS